MFPMAHIGMSKKNWRYVVDLDKVNYTLNGESVLKKVFQVYGKDFRQKNDKGKFSFSYASSTWFTDQRLISVFVKKYATTSSKITLDLRSYSGVRLDRTKNEAEWNGKLENVDALTDAHLYQVHSEMSMRLFRKFLIKYFSHKTDLIIFYNELILNFWNF
jgi:hypothetical protein